MADIEFEIDGKKLVAKPNQTVIQVADEAGIYIPRFCYHKELSIAANCRMCLVDVEKSPKPLPACATPVMPGMKVFTKSQKTIDAQRAVMQFLLINHPLDCPICDQGGECELQDIAMGYGSSHSNYDECKRAVADQDLGPLIATEMTRCIYCTRCVRFGDEIAGLREMGAIGRGEDTEIGTYVTHAIKSEVSGNIIDLCPVGALTSKPFRFRARAWELDQAPSISAHDCLGSNIYVHTRYGKVMRVVSRENMAINEMWLSDRDRFSYTGLYHADRLQDPVARINGKWQVIEWQKAFELISTKLQDSIVEFGANQMGALLSPNSTTEECYLLQKILRGLGSNNIDHRLREKNTDDQNNMAAFPGLNMSIAELEDCDAVLLIGSNIQKEVPLAALRLRKAALKGAAITAINPVDYHFNFKTSAKSIIAPHRMVESVGALLNALKPEFNEVKADETAKALAAQLKDKKKVGILLGAFALQHEEATMLHYLAQQIAEVCGGKIGFLTTGANSAGAWLAGAIPHRQAGGIPVSEPGLSAYDMLAKPLKAYVLLNVEPDLDCANPANAVAALKAANFVVAISTFRNSVLDEHADIILPSTPFTETSGTFVNVTGEWQSFHGVATTAGGARPAWKILRVLGNFLHLAGFDFESSEAVKHEVHALLPNMPQHKGMTKPAASATKNTHYSRIGEFPIYATDNIVRRAEPLQKTQTLMEGKVEVVRLHPNTAKALSVKDGDIVRIQQQTGCADLPVMIDKRVAENAAWVAGGIEATSQLGDLFGDVDIQKV